MRMTKLSVALIVLAGILIDTVSPAVAQRFRLRFNQCTAIRVLPGSSLVNGKISEYSLKARSNPPGRVLTPGETYEIRYDVVTRCTTSCGRIHTTTLVLRAVPGADRSQLDRNHKAGSNNGVIGSHTVDEHNCGDARVIFVRFTVPSPRSIGGGQRDVETVSMGACPPRVKFNCAGHTIRVRNASYSGWQVTKLRTLQRAIGSGVNRVSSTQQITLAATIINGTGRSLSVKNNVSTFLVRISGPSGASSGSQLATQPVPGIRRGARQRVLYRIGPLSPGVYAFKACARGLRDTRNYPLPDVCGPPIALTSGVAAGANWAISAVSTAPGTPNPVPPNTRFGVRGSVYNRSSINNPPGARFAMLWHRGLGFQTNGSRIATIQMGFIRRHTAKLARFDNLRFAPGEHEVRICIADDPNQSTLDTICSPWRRISVRLSGPGSSPIPPAGPSPPTAIRCTGGIVRRGRCLCPTGRYRVRIGQYAYACRLSARGTAPGNRYDNQTRPTARLRCIGGQMRGRLCWCGIGRFPQRVGTYTYRCR